MGRVQGCGCLRLFCLRPRRRRRAVAGCFQLRACGSLGASMVAVSCCSMPAPGVGLRSRASGGWDGVEVVLANVSGDAGADEIADGLALLDAAAKFGGGDVLMDGIEEVDAARDLGGEALDGGLGERVAGAADDDPLGQGEQPV